MYPTTCTCARVPPRLIPAHDRIHRPGCRCKRRTGGVVFACPLAHRLHANGKSPGTAPRGLLIPLMRGRKPTPGSCDHGSDEDLAERPRGLAVSRVCLWGVCVCVCLRALIDTLPCHAHLPLHWQAGPGWADSKDREGREDAPPDSAPDLFSTNSRSNTFPCLTFMRQSPDLGSRHRRLRVAAVLQR